MTQSHSLKASKELTFALVSPFIKNAYLLKLIHRHVSPADEEWYEKMPSLPSMIFENQYSLKKLKVSSAKGETVRAFTIQFSYVIQNLDEYISSLYYC